MKRSNQDSVGNTAGNTAYRFNFTASPKPGYVTVSCDKKDGAPHYDEAIGYGFVEWTQALPPRKVHRAQIQAGAGGFELTEPHFDAVSETGNEHDNRYGMAFRIKLPCGAYTVQVKITSDPAATTVAVSGMNAAALSRADYWDAARLVPNRTRPVWDGQTWTYDCVSGRNELDIEIEPASPGHNVGVAEIVLAPVPVQPPAAHELPKIFLLGDSTVKSYIFEEAPMSGWGQVFGNLFDHNRVKIANYAMGGRSFKSSYTEGRFNDILMTGRTGDYILIQFGHNDETEDETIRFGRGSTEDMYRYYIEEIYIPAVRARGMIPLLVTPVSRTDGGASAGHVYSNSFVNRRFPEIMREMAQKLQVTLIDLNKDSIDYYNELGVEATTSVFMSIEAGETPGKTNDGSYANGHPCLKNDGTHYKESLSKAFARMVAVRIAGLGGSGDTDSAVIASFLKAGVLEAIRTGDWSAVYPEMAADMLTGPHAYYRNQVEKLLQLEVLSTDPQRNFNPDELIRCNDYAEALAKVMGLNPTLLEGSKNTAVLTREKMGAMLHDAYQAYFAAKPAYLTDYNGENAGPGDPDYDPCLSPEARGIMYYPLVSFDQLRDTGEIDPLLLPKIRTAYELGLLRAEKGIRRGELSYARELEPKLLVSRSKAAKSLYYMWVLKHPVHIENHVLA